MIQECTTLNGVRPSSVNNMITGPGKIFFNVDETKLTDPNEADPIGTATALALALGVTRGGSVFNVAKEMRGIEYDGKRGENKGLTVKESENAKLTVNFSEIDKQALMFSLPGADFEVLANGITVITPGSCLRLKDYIDNIFLIASHGNRQLPIGILLRNVINMSDFELSIQDRDEANPSNEFVSNYDPSDPQNIPYRLFMSNEQGFYGVLENLNGNALDVNLTASGTGGTTTTAELTISWILGYGDDVSVELIDLPAGITLTGAPITVANGTVPATVLTFAVADGTFKGSYVGQVKLTGPNQIVQYIAVRFIVT